MTYGNVITAGGWGMWLLAAVFVGALITWMVLLARRRSQRASTRDAAERTLAERFARGEIDRNDFTHRLAELHEAQHYRGHPREETRS